MLDARTSRYVAVPQRTRAHAATRWMRIRRVAGQRALRGLVLRRAVRLQAEGNRSDALTAGLSAVEDHDAALMMHDRIAEALNDRAVCLMQADRLLTA